MLGFAALRPTSCFLCNDSPGSPSNSISGEGEFKCQASDRGRFMKPLTFRFLFMCLLLAVPMSLQAGYGSLALIGGTIFPLTTSAHLDDLRIKITPATIGRVGLVRLENQDDKSVRCRALFRSGPENIGRRQVVLKPGRSATLGKAVWRYAARLHITVTCKEV